MIKSSRSMLIALLFPVLALGLLAGYKKYRLSSGQEIILPITGYDPRDLLSGHYLTYTIQYGVENICHVPDSFSDAVPGYICLEPRYFTFQLPSQANHEPKGSKGHKEKCRSFIKGVCRYGQFKAGIERFYVPEEKAEELEKLLQSRPAELIITVSPGGTAQVKDLHIK